MTPAELQELVTSVEAPDTVSTLNNGFYTLTPDELLALCHRVQAQALRETAEWFASEWQKDDPAVYRLNRMADELDPVVYYAGQDPMSPLTKLIGEKK